MLARLTRRVVSFFSTTQSKELLALKIIAVFSIYLAVLAAGRALFGQGQENVELHGTVLHVGSFLSQGQ